jgi:CheY-like chemotaxis protein
MPPHPADRQANQPRTENTTVKPPSSYVLVVDDEAVVCEFLSRCIEGWGYAVRKASSAAEALEMMVAKPASIVLCDIRMPGQDGLWLAERLRAHWPSTAVIMATAIDDVQTVTQSRALGAVDYINKPITQDQLLQAIRRAAATLKDESPENSSVAPPDLQSGEEAKIEAEYTLESPVRCPACGERIGTLKAVRLIRAQVNFTSTLPRRGRIMVCPNCMAAISAELTNF